MFKPIISTLTPKPFIINNNFLNNENLNILLMREYYTYSRFCINGENILIEYGDINNTYNYIKNNYNKIDKFKFEDNYGLYRKYRNSSMILSTYLDDILTPIKFIHIGYHIYIHNIYGLKDMNFEDIDIIKNKHKNLDLSPTAIANYLNETIHKKRSFKYNKYSIRIDFDLYTETAMYVIINLNITNSYKYFNKKREQILLNFFDEFRKRILNE